MVRAGSVGAGCPSYYYFKVERYTIKSIGKNNPLEEKQTQALNAHESPKSNVQDEPTSNNNITDFSEKINGKNPLDIKKTQEPRATVNKSQPLEPTSETSPALTPDIN